MTTDSAASTQSATGRPQSTPKPVQQAADADDDQPLRPLGDADVAGQAEPLGAGLDVRDDLAGDQAEQRGDHGRARLARSSASQ